MTGADVAIFASAFAYISDVSSVENRTIRVTILDACYLSTMPIGLALGSYLFTYVVNESYVVMFALNAALLAIAIVYTILHLQVIQKLNIEKEVFTFNTQIVVHTVENEPKAKVHLRGRLLWIGARLLRSRSRRPIGQDDAAAARNEPSCLPVDVDVRHAVLHVPARREANDLFVHADQVQLGHGTVQSLQDVPVDRVRGDDAVRHSHHEQAAALSGHGEFNNSLLLFYRRAKYMKH